MCGHDPEQLGAVFLLPWPGQRFVARPTTVDRSERCITVVWRYPCGADGKQSTVRVPDRKDVARVAALLAIGAHDGNHDGAGGFQDAARPSLAEPGGVTAPVRRRHQY